MTDIVDGGMSDNSGLSDIGLRDRIATALRTADRRVAGFISYEERADAVIAELGLWQQWSNWHEGYYRYVTDWSRR